jgi:hypothetical protein
MISNLFAITMVTLVFGAVGIIAIALHSMESEDWDD